MKKEGLGIRAEIGSCVMASRIYPEGLGGDSVGALFANGAAGGFSADLLVSSFVFWILAFAESRRLGLARPWAYIVLNLLIGLSCALPLFLYFRERKLLEVP